jgi:DDE family transposase
MIAKEHILMIPYSPLFDQTVLEHLVQNDKVVQRYREFFSLIDWKSVQQYQADRTLSDRPSHPEEAYIKAFLVKIIEGKKHMTQLRTFLVEHPLLTAELGFRLHLDPTQPYGIDLEKTLPKKRWFNAKLRSLDHSILQDLLTGSVRALQEIIPGLGETMAVDVKHIYAWVRENNPRESIKDRFCKDRQPKGDPDCRVGVKKSTNIEQADGSTKKKKEYLWGYGSGVAAATIGGYGDVVIAEHTLPFNEGDITYYLPLYNQAVSNINFFPTYVTADAAYDAWYVYQTCAFHGGIAAVPLNKHGHENAHYDKDGTPICEKGLRMHPTIQFRHTNGYRAQRFVCPLLFPHATGETCNHEQFKKGKGCRKDPNWEAGGKMRVTLDRTSPLYKTIYRQRTCAERINSQAKELGIERPFVRNIRSVRNINTLIYLIINVRALQRANSINKGLLPMS